MRQCKYTGIVTGGEALGWQSVCLNAWLLLTGGTIRCFSLTTLVLEP